LISGFVADAFGLSAPFALLGVLAILSALSIALYVRDVPLQATRLGLGAIKQVLYGRPIRLGLLLVFTTFFTFSGLLTALPFRLVELDPGISPASISVVYLGYVIGIFIPLLLDRLITAGITERRALSIGITLLCIGLGGVSLPNTGLIMGFFFVLSTGMFTIHATAAGWLNKLRPAHAGVVNGAYISNYYAAAAIASVIPLWLIALFGWRVYIISQLLLAFTAYWQCRKLAESVSAEKISGEAHSAASG